METMEALFTRTDYEKLPEGFPAQLIGGGLIRDPAPRFGHQAIGSVIHAKLVQLVDPKLVPLSPVDVAVDEHNVFQPDLVVLRSLPPFEAQYVGVPLLAMEILSPATEQLDRYSKTEKLLDLGVEEVWLIDPYGKSIEIHEAAGVRRFRGSEVAASGALEGFALVPAELFAG